jgi:5-methylcytosine-specific restriction endonuclease McrA
MNQSVSTLKKKLWKLFSEYIRRRDKGICFTCGRVQDWKLCDAGHFIPRSVGGLALFFHEDNVHAQCKRCNMPPLCGNQYEYGRRLGEKKVKELRKLQSQITKWSRQDYQDKIAHYQEKLKEYDA